MKSKIIEYLKENKEKLVTGTEIANILSITRSYVSKIVSMLVQEGYSIEIINRSGYIYHNDLKVISLNKILNNVHNENRYHFTILEKVDSTNAYLKEKNNSKSDQIEVAIANEQTNGIGRLSRSFISNKGKGIYMSFLYHPKVNLDIAKRITACVSVGVARAIDKICKTSTKIKWVNDIYLNNKKICGILSVGSTNLELNSLDYIIVGIGINLYSQKFPPELKDIATSIYDETKNTVDRSILISEILNEVFNLLDNLETNEFILEYRSKSLVIGKTVELQSLLQKEIVKVIDIDDDGELIVEKDGIVKKVYSGEISRMRLNYE